MPLRGGGLLPVNQRLLARLPQVVDRYRQPMRSPIDVGGGDIGLDLVAFDRFGRARAIDRIEQREQIGRFVMFLMAAAVSYGTAYWSAIDAALR